MLEVQSITVRSILTLEKSMCFIYNQYAVLLTQFLPVFSVLQPWTLDQPKWIKIKTPANCDGFMQVYSCPHLAMNVSTLLNICRNVILLCRGSFGWLVGLLVFFAVGYELLIFSYVCNTCLGKTDLPDVPYRVSLRLRPRTLHKEVQSVLSMRLFL